MAEFSYKECEIDVDALEGVQEEFDDLHGKITGRSDSFNTITEPVSIHFSGLISESLRDAALENREAWESSMMACYHAYGQTGKIIDCVEWYEEEIEGIRSRLRTALSSMASTGDEEDDLSIRNATINRHTEEATEAWGALEDKIGEVDDELSEGPTPSGIRELVADGYLGSNIAFAATGDTDYFHFDANSGEEVGEELREELESQGDPATISAYFMLISALVERARQHQEDGEELSEGEVDFLDLLHQELDKIDNEDGPSGVLAIPEIVGSGDWDFSAEEIDDIRNAMAGATLALSDEDLGGSFIKLPESIQDVVLGPSLQSDEYNRGYAENGYAEDLEALALLLRDATPGMEGGDLFSSSLTISMGRMMYELVQYPDSEPMASVLDHVDYHTIADLLDISTRNYDANHTVLTQDYINGVYLDDESAAHMNSQALEGLFLFEWPSAEDFPDDTALSEDSIVLDGAAVRGLFDWISEETFSDDPEEQRRAAEAVIGLIEFTTDPEIHDRLMNTGVSVSNEDFDYRNAGFGQYNGEIADSLAGVFEAYIYSFADHTGVDENGIPDLDWERPNDWPTWDSDSNTLSLSPSEKLMFLELIMTNDDAASRAHGASEMFLYAQQEEAVRTGNLDDTAKRSATLQGYIDAALHNEAVLRSDDAEKVQSHKERIYDSVSSLVSGQTGKFPLGWAISEAGGYYSDDLKQEIFGNFVAPSAHGENGGEEEYNRNSLRVHLIDQAFKEAVDGGGVDPLDLVGGETREEGGESVYDILSENGAITYDDDGNRALDMDEVFSSMNGLKGGDLAELNWALSATVNGIEVDWTSGVDQTGLAFLESFSGSFDARGSAFDSLELTKEQIEDRKD